MSVEDIWTGLVNNIINPLVGFVFVLAVLLFLYGMVRFLANQDNEEKQREGKKHMVWGIVGIAIMVSAWAIVAFLQNTLGA